MVQRRGPPLSVGESESFLTPVSQDTVYLQLDHCCYFSNFNSVEIYLETMTSFTDLLTENVLREKEIPFGSLLYVLGVSSKAT